MTRLTVFREIAACVAPRTPHLSAPTLRTMIRMMAVPKERCLTVPLTPAGDQVARCRIALTDTSGWSVRLEIDDRTVALTCCADSHHVERLCSMLARIWAGCHTELPASR